MHGDPRWDANGIFAFGNHLRKGGMWLLKKENITGFSSVLAPDGVNRSISAGANNLDSYMHTGNIPNATPGSAPTIFDRNKYFFLPAAGKYSSRYGNDPAILEDLGTEGTYWGTDGTPSPPNRNYSLIFTQDNIKLASYEMQTYLRILPIWKAQ